MRCGGGRLAGLGLAMRMVGVVFERAYCLRGSAEV